MTPVKPNNDPLILDLTGVSTPEQIEKAYAAFGEILSRRKFELSEKKRVNQHRLTDEGKFITSSEYSPYSDNRMHSVSAALVMTADLAHVNTTPSVRELVLKSNSTPQAPSRVCPASSTAIDRSQFTNSVDKDEDLAYRIVYDIVPSNGPTTPFSARSLSEEHIHTAASYSTAQTSSSSTLSSTFSSVALNETVCHELAQQLKSEKMRVTELSAKISELRGLEEEQRQRARLLSDEGDSGLRSSLYSKEVEVSTLREMYKKQMEQINHKSSRIADLERILGEYRSRESDMREEIAMAGQLAEAKNMERDRYMKRMNEAVESLSKTMRELQRAEEKYKALQRHCEELESNGVSVSDEQYEEQIAILQRECDDLSANKHNLLHQQISMMNKMNKAHEALQVARDELDVVECDKALLWAEFEELSQANKSLIAQNNTLLADIRASKAAESRSKEEFAMCRNAARAADLSAEQFLEAMQQMEKTIDEIEADRSVHANAHGHLLRLVEIEKLKNIKDFAVHQLKVCVLLLIVWVLVLGLIDEVNVGLRPCTHDATRMTY